MAWGHKNKICVCFVRLMMMQVIVDNYYWTFVVCVWSAFSFCSIHFLHNKCLAWDRLLVKFCFNLNSKASSTYYYYTWTVEIHDKLYFTRFTQLSLSISIARHHLNYVRQYSFTCSRTLGFISSVYEWNSPVYQVWSLVCYPPLIYVFFGLTQWVVPIH